MRQRNVPPCCCLGFASAQSNPWCVVYSAGATGFFAPMNNGIILPYSDDGFTGARCRYQCSTLPFTGSVQTNLVSVANGVGTRRVQVLGQGVPGNVAFRCDIPSSAAFHCRRNAAATPTVFFGTMPPGSSAGSLLGYWMFKTLADAKARFTSGWEGCVPDLEE